MSDKKKERGCNFSKSEVNLLMTMILQDLHIIENKKLDGASAKEKKQVWTRITKLFNASYPEGRDMNSLKVKYENIKRNFKKKITDENFVPKKIGGSDHSNKLLWYEEKMYGFLKSTIDSMKSMGEKRNPLEVSTCNKIGKVFVNVA